MKLDYRPLAYLALGCVVTTGLYALGPGYLKAGEIGPSPMPTISIGTISGLPAGSTPTATMTGTSPNLTLSMGLTAGNTGSSGSNGSNGTNGSNGSAATVAAGSVSTLAAGASATVANVGTSSAAVFNFGIPQGAIGTTGATGAAGTNGANGTNAIATSARQTTDTSGLYTWTYPAACVHGGNIPALTAIAEGPNPQAGVNANVQLEGVPTATAASFRVTKTQNTTVALLGLTITVAVTGTGIGATVLDLGCSPQ